MNEKFLLQHGLALIDQGEWEEAAGAFWQAVQLNPDYWEGYCNLGMVLYELKKLPEAEACLRQAVELNKDHAGGYNNLGLVLLAREQWEEAEACFRRAMGLDPYCDGIYGNLGLLLEATGREEEGEAMFQKAISHNKKDGKNYYNLGRLLRNQGRLEEAKAAYERALELLPDYEPAQFGLGVVSLLQGDFQKGWPIYDRLRMDQAGRRPEHIPLWRGERLEKKRLLLFYEQGFGDTIQFVRYAPEIAAWGNQVTVWVQPELHQLVAESCPECVVYSGNHPPEGEYDVACSLPSLPGLMEEEAGIASGKPAYLTLNPALGEEWKRRLTILGSPGALRVGLVWAGNPHHSNDRNRSVSLPLFQPLMELTGMEWVSLQVGERREDLQGIPWKVADFSRQLTDFSQTAALIGQLDVVIAADSAVAHLAGALGIPVWMLVPFAPDWRWQLDREDTPWYPAMRLFRQETRGDWTGVVERVKKALEEKLAKG